jgi:hypothetical protein
VAGVRRQEDAQAAPEDPGAVRQSR